ncbi:hypothetical protein DFJ74DRAFT_666351 [Hyaloraphidium curvatum]|nr:hypothetical protein DFJ74DRAFT_666351 [Hyaloraphidium curvatum]
MARKERLSGRRPAMFAALAAIFAAFLFATSPVSAQCAGTTYTVQRGDTCFDIATRFGVTLAQLVAANPPGTCENLDIGNVLCIPTAQTTTQTTTASSLTTSLTAASTTSGTTTTTTGSPTATPSSAQMILRSNATAALACSYNLGSCSLVADPNSAFGLRAPSGNLPPTEAGLATTPFNLVNDTGCMTVDAARTNVFLQECSSTVADRQLFTLDKESDGSSRLKVASSPTSCVVTTAGNAAQIGPCSSAQAAWSATVNGLTTVTPTASPTPGPSSDGLSTGAIVGIVIGALAGVALLGGLAWFLVSRNKKKSAGPVYVEEGKGPEMVAAASVEPAPGYPPVPPPPVPVSDIAATPATAFNGTPAEGLSYSAGATASANAAALPPPAAALPPPAALPPLAPSLPPPVAPPPIPTALPLPSDETVPPRVVTLKRGASLSPNSATVSSYKVPPSIPVPDPPVAAAAAGQGSGLDHPAALATVAMPTLAIPTIAPSPPQPVVIEPGTVAIATKGYLPRENDEIEVRPGDSVSIESVYEDGWCKGRNARTGARGVLPAACFE